MKLKREKKSNSFMIYLNVIYPNWTNKIFAMKSNT